MIKISLSRSVINNTNKVYGFVYITTNLINGKRYIGQKKFDNKSRWKSYIGSGTYLKNAISKYGKENFKRVIVDFAFSQEDINKKEFDLIQTLNAVESEHYYNQIDGGDLLQGLKKSNSVKCICIDNGLKFHSISDASYYAGWQTSKVVDSFKIKHSYDYVNEPLIFRRVDDVEVSEGKVLCTMCGSAKRGVKDLNNSGRGICLACRNLHKRQRNVAAIEHTKKLRDKSRRRNRFNKVIIKKYIEEGLSIKEIAIYINAKDVQEDEILEILKKKKIYVERTDGNSIN